MLNKTQMNSNTKVTHEFLMSKKLNIKLRVIMMMMNMMMMMVYIYKLHEVTLLTVGKKNALRWFLQTDLQIGTLVTFTLCIVTPTAWKVSIFGVILVRIFSHSDWCGVSLRIQSKCGKMRTRVTLNTDTFYVVLMWFKKFGYQG